MLVCQDRAGQDLPIGTGVGAIIELGAAETKHFAMTLVPA